MNSMYYSGAIIVNFEHMFYAGIEAAIQRCFLKQLQKSIKKQNFFRVSHLGCSAEKGALKNFANFTVKTTVFRSILCMTFFVETRWQSSLLVIHVDKFIQLKLLQEFFNDLTYLEAHFIWLLLETPFTYICQCAIDVCINMRVAVRKMRVSTP